ncbi:Alpha/Beta hydrolase protein [Cercophora samala]|uniref:Alpha/Beta hydrolase protein n=1 Tax=Cercophora samala TaxID=330535 RepID=A0AA40DEE2_9PEZI|nr:Alpha/Beta hydrolase protein [Cercophora samala]
MPYFTSPTPGPPVSIYYIDESPPPSSSTTPPTHTCLLIPGITCDLSDWSWQVPFLLSKGFRVVTPDPRGQGRSSAPPSAVDEGIYTPEALSSDLAALLTHLGITSNVIAIGHSLGTCTAVHLAATHPDLVLGLVLLDPLHCMSSATCDELFSDPGTTMQNLMVQFAARGLVPTTQPGPEWDWHMTWIQRRGMVSLFPSCKHTYLPYLGWEKKGADVICEYLGARPKHHCGDDIRLLDQQEGVGQEGSVDGAGKGHQGEEAHAGEQ